MQSAPILIRRELVDSDRGSIKSSCDASSRKQPPWRVQEENTTRLGWAHCSFILIHFTTRSRFKLWALHIAVSTSVESRLTETKYVQIVQRERARGDVKWILALLNMEMNADSQRWCWFVIWKGNVRDRSICIDPLPLDRWDYFQKQDGAIKWNVRGV